MASILIVDDLAIFRDPVAAAIAKHGHEARTASNGDEAIRMISQNRPDLVLLDVFMPGMDGFTVLRLLRHNEPIADIPVIMLTDASERHDVITARKLGVASYMIKSALSLEKLLSTIDQVLESADADPAAAETAPAPRAPAGGASSDQPAATPRGAATPTTGAPKKFNKNFVLSQIKEMLGLRPVNPVLHRAISQTGSRDTSIHDIVQTIRQDQALAVRILKVANSAYYSAGSRVENLLEAVGHIGMSGVRNSIATAVAMDHFAVSDDSELNVERFWEHSLGTASIAQGLADLLDREDAEDIYLAALMHDIGRLVLATVFPAEYTEVSDRAANAGRLLEDEEFETFGMSHTAITAEVLRSLRMSDKVIKAASLHDREASYIRSVEAGPVPGLLVALSNRLAHFLLMGDSGSSMLRPYDGFVGALDLSEEVIADTARAAAERMDDTALSYADKETIDFLPPLSRQLSSGTGGAVAARVLAENAPNDPVSMLLEQLKWIDPDSPDLTILVGDSMKTIEQRYGTLIDDPGETRFAAVLTSPIEGGTSPRDEPEGGQRIPQMSLPCRHNELIDWLRFCSHRRNAA